MNKPQSYYPHDPNNLKYADGKKKLCMRNGAAIFTILNETLQFFVTTFIDNFGLELIRH